MLGHSLKRKERKKGENETSRDSINLHELFVSNLSIQNIEKNKSISLFQTHKFLFCRQKQSPFFGCSTYL